MDDRLTVLVVDDDDGLREIVRYLLEGEGLSVLEAADPMAALDIAASTPRAIDLLLTDVIMPGIDGVELARRVQTIRPATPVLYMSGSPEEDLVARGVLATGMRFLAKPFGADALLDHVRCASARPAGRPARREPATHRWNGSGSPGAWSSLARGLVAMTRPPGGAHPSNGPIGHPDRGGGPPSPAEPAYPGGAAAATPAQEVAVLRRRVADLQTASAEVHQRKEALHLAMLTLGHELNGPLSVLIPRIELMRWEAQEHALPRSILEDLAVLQRHAERLGRLVKIMLDLSIATGPIVGADARGSDGTGSCQDRAPS